MLLNFAIIIVSWNVRDLLTACLDSISNLQSPTSNLQPQIIVVDNASTDGSAEMVASHFPHVRLIANQHNLGFAGGNNQAMRALGFPISNIQYPITNLPRYILLLNPDTVVRGRAIETMVTFMDSTPQAGACGARLVYGDGGFQHSAFGFPGLIQIALDFWPLHGRLLGSRLNGRYPRKRYAAGAPFEIDHPLGASLMVRAETIVQVGLMDEAYHMYCEEIDWCWRIKRAGWKIYCAPQAEIVHYGGQSTAQARPEMIVALWRSRKRLYGKHYPAWKRRLAGMLVQAGARAEIRRAGTNSALAGAYGQVIELFRDL
jgi:N-acetylglucosaminyl-diphospho-decaprenol L-rhamnosyltransferase